MKTVYIINKRELWKNIQFIMLIIAIFPTDFKEYIPYGRQIVFVLPLLAFLLGVIKFAPQFIVFLKKHWQYWMPFVVSVVASFYNSTNIITSLYKLYIILLTTLLAVAFFEKDKRFFSIAESYAFFILAINCLVMYINNGPLNYSATGGRIYFIFEGSIGKLLMADITLFYITKGSYKKNYILRMIIYLLTLIKLIGLSVTNSVCIILICIYMFFCKKIKNFDRMASCLKLYFVIIVILNYLVISENITVLLAKIFKKSVTLSSRTIIWTSALDIISKNPIFGIGQFDSTYFMELTNVRGATHGHNQIIQILLNSGYIGLILHIFSFWKLSRIRYFIQKNEIYLYYIGYLLASLIGCLTGNFFDNFFYLMLIILLEEITRDIKKNYKK